MTQPHTRAALVLAAILATTSALSSAAATPKEATGEYFDDTIVTTKVKAAVFNEPTLKSTEINVETFKGVVQLSGFVRSESDIKKAIEVTSAVKGVNSVKSVMTVKGQ